MANRIITATTCSDNSTNVYVINDNNVDFSKIYQLSNGLCSTLTSGDTTGDDINISIISIPYEDCEECLTPLSANTEYVACVECSGGTYTVIVPHPTYTNNQGQAVVQLNAVTLGGPNGLNN